jgi:hypothetical protein
MRPPAVLSELTEAERLAAWAFRRWVAGHARGDCGHWTLVLRELGRVCGGRGGRDTPLRPRLGRLPFRPLIDKPLPLG